MPNLVGVRRLLPINGLFCLALFSTLPCAADIVITFDNLSDSEIVTNQYPDLTFSNTIILTAGISLNEFEFPPHSGMNVASDNGGPISISFASPVVSVSGYFTYFEPLTLFAFDSSGQQVSSATSLFSSNMALSGDVGASPNELLALSSPGGISSVVFAGDAGGGSFTVDDLSYTATAPEPSSMFLFLTAAAFAARCIKQRL